MLKYLFSFQGRIGRAKFWLGFLIVILMSIVTQILMPLIDGVSFEAALADNYEPSPASIILMVVSLVLTIWISIAIAVKRCHDRGQSGWYYLIALIPIVGFFWYIINLGILKGDHGPNKYGPDPLGLAATADVFA